jgi:hypothetical protein
MPGISGRIERELLAVLRKYVGEGGNLEPSALLGKDLNLLGWDAIEFMEEVERNYGVDLRPLVEKNTQQLLPTLWHKVFGISNSSIDLSVRQIAEYVARQTKGAGHLRSSE